MQLGSMTGECLLEILVQGPVEVPVGLYFQILETEEGPPRHCPLHFLANTLQVQKSL